MKSSGFTNDSKMCLTLFEKKLLWESLIMNAFTNSNTKETVGQFSLTPDSDLIGCLFIYPVLIILLFSTVVLFYREYVANESTEINQLKSAWLKQKFSTHFPTRDQIYLQWESADSWFCFISSNPKHTEWKLEIFQNSFTSKIPVGNQINWSLKEKNQNSKIEQRWNMMLTADKIKNNWFNSTTVWYHETCNQ